MKNRWSSILHDNDLNKISSKRIIAVMLVLTLITVTLSNLFFQFKVEPYIFQGLTDALIWGLGFIGSENVTKNIAVRFKNNPDPNGETEEDMK